MVYTQENCKICGKDIKFKAYSIDQIRKDVCRKCRFDLLKIEPHKTMSNEERIKLLLKKRSEEEICDNCGEKRKAHIDYFGTGKKNVCHYRKSMHFKLNKTEAPSSSHG